ncbi:glycosyltransferase [Marivita sp.]|uniref:glycosyltransferase n=1 Tax=Marivita sp. TaxID=2003365 RepID=UPI0025BB4032|nr:glycosyltransferase [Marivita sp.]
MHTQLRIALITEPSGGGSGRHVLDLALGLAGRGHDVTVIWSPVRAQADFVDKLTNAALIRNVPLEMNRAVGLADAKAYLALARLLRQEGPFDILHAHSSKAGALIRLLPKSIPGARIYTPHAFRTMDPDLKTPQRFIYGTIERLFAPRAAKIIAVSEAERLHAVSELRIAPHRLQRVVNGAELPKTASRATARAKMGLCDDQVAVGFIGRLEKQKDPIRFVRSVKAAARHVPNLCGVVIGDGVLRAEAEDAANGGRIDFMGWQDGPALFPALDIFCMTSQYEAMPYTLLEALHAGVPIVMTAVGGAEETVIHGENGYVLPLEDDANTLSDVLVELAGDAEKRIAFGQASRRLAETRTIEAMMTGTLDIYMQNGGPGRELVQKKVS